MLPVFLVVTRAELGGAQRFVLELAAELRGKGEVTLVAGEEGWLLEAGRELGLRGKVLPALARSSNPLRALAYVAQLYRLLRTDGRRPVVHLNSSNALAGSLAGKLAGSRVVFTVHGLSVLDAGYQARWFAKAAYWLWFRLWFSFVDEIVAVSRHNAKRLRELGLGDATVVPNGIAAPRFMERAEARAELGLEGPAVMTVGRLEYSKRQDLLLAAWAQVVARVPEARLVIIGDGPERATLEEQAASLGIMASVTFAGSRPEASRLLPAADAFVLPSRYEGWPIVLLESLRAGVPSVASAVGGVPELLGDAGIVIEADAGAEAWAAAIAGLLGDADERARLAAAARERGKRWDAAGMAAAYGKLYAE